MENKKWTREEAEQNKNKLLEELKELPTSEERLKWVVKELNQLIDEEEVRQNKQDIPKHLINFIDELVGGEKNDKYHISPLVIDPITNNFQHSIIEINNGIKTIKYTLKIESL